MSKNTKEDNRHNRIPNDLTGHTFGKLTVLGLSNKRGSRGKRTIALWECKCECGTITYKPRDVLLNASISMCAACAAKYASQKARQAAGFVEGTQIARIRAMTPGAGNTSGVRGVVYEKRTNKWRARLCFRGKDMSFGSYAKFEDAVAARKAAEINIFGAFLEEIESNIKGNDE